MNKQLRKLAVLILAILTGLLLVGCSKETETVTDYEHTIVFYSTQGDALQKVTDNAIKAFQDKYPGWRVYHTQVGGYDDVKKKIISDLGGKLQPDIAYCYADHVAQYVETKKVVDMSTLINTGEVTVKVKGDDGSYSKEVKVNLGYSEAEIADFVPGYYKEGLASNYADYEANGYSATSMLTMPFVKSTELLYYNNSALKELGLEPAKTWDELWEQAALIRKKWPTVTPLGYDSEANWFITMCEQNGWGYTSAQKPHYLFKNDDTQAWLEQLADYYDKGYITTQAESGAYTSNLFVKGVEDNGIVYCIGSSGGASYQQTSKFEWGITRIPYTATEKEGVNNKAVISQGPSLVMFKTDRSANVEEKQMMTFLFMKELLDPTFQAAFSIAAGYNPCRQSTYDVPTYQTHLDGDTATAKACVVAQTMTADFYTSPAFVGSSEARTQVGNALVFALTGEKDAGKALSDAYKNCGGQ